MIADSFLRGTGENVALSLNNKYGIYSMAKAGCDLNTLQKKKKSVLGSLTHKNVILNCGGSNDFNFDKDETIIDHIMEFLKTHNHTNIVRAHVPV
jgi:hypothetical protein